MLRIVLYRFFTLCFGVNWGSCHWNITEMKICHIGHTKVEALWINMKYQERRNLRFCFENANHHEHAFDRYSKIGFAQWHYIMKDLLTYHITFGFWDKRMIDWLVEFRITFHSRIFHPDSDALTNFINRFLQNQWALA